MKEVMCKQCGRLIKDGHARGMCEKHYKQFKKYGYCLDNNPRTIYDLNEITTDNEYAYIHLYDQNCNEVAVAKIDKEDIAIVKYIKWKYRKDCGYVVNTGTRADRRAIHLHRLIMGLDKGTYNDECVVDHINGDPLDNRKANLRIVNKSTNAMNLKNIPKGYMFTGKKWSAYIKINQHMIFLGQYIHENEAAFARYIAEKILFKDMAYKREEPIVENIRKENIIEYVKGKCRDYNGETRSAD